MKAPKKKRASNGLLEIVDLRGRKIERINDLRNDLYGIENDIKVRLIEEGQTDLLKVDWNRLNKQL